MDDNLTTEETSQRHGVEDQETVYQPPSYGPLDPEKPGWWFVTDDGNVVVWTDYEDGAGVSWAESTPVADRLWRHFVTARGAGVGAGPAYQLAFREEGKPEEHEGPLSGVGEALGELPAAE